MWSFCSTGYAKTIVYKSVQQKQGKHCECNVLIFYFGGMQKMRCFLIALACFGMMLHLHAQHFVANDGQWPEPFAYKLDYGNAAVFLSSDALRFNLRAPEALAHFHDEDGRHHIPEIIRHHAFEVQFHGAAEFISPQKKSDTYHNYYLSKNPSTWRGNVGLYEELIYTNVYAGIDMVLKAGANNLKYDIVVHPNANTDVLRWTYAGVYGLRLHNGKLYIQTSVGEVVEDAPVAWQIINGSHVPVDVAYKLDTSNTLVFVVGDYNPAHTLIIDPNFIFSSYTGSTADNFGYTATYDAQGNTYGGGIVFGLGYPVTLGAFQTTPGGGSIDIGISKFNAAGTSLIYSTYLGGSQNEQPHSMVVDSLGNLVVIGITGSANFPISSGAFDTIFSPGPAITVNFMPFGQGTDIFISKFNAAGTQLLASTFLGGSGIDGANQQIAINYGDQGRAEVVVDQNGDVFFISTTTSNNFPTAGSALQNTIGGGQDAVVGKLNSALTQMIWGTYLGGSLADAGYGIQLNPAQNILYATGGTRSTNFNTFGTPHQATHAGDVDGFIVSFSSANGAAIASTLNGTTGYDQNFFVAVDSDGDVYVFGQTKGAYPVSPGVFSVQNGTQFIHKFSSDLQQSKKSMVFGSGSATINISPTALMVDKCKHVYISGWGGNVNYEGNTNGLPTTPDAFDSITDGSDFYFMVLDATWTYLRYATFFGGNGDEHVDGGTSRFSPEGIIHQVVCAGCGGASSFPAFPANVVSTTNNSQNCNMACMRIDFEQQEILVEIELVPDSGCVPFTLTWIDKSKNVDVYQWNFGDGTVASGKNPTKVFTQAGTYSITVIGSDTLCNNTDTTQMVVHVSNPTVAAQFTFEFDSCDVPIQVKFFNQNPGAPAYWWSFGNNQIGVQPNPVIIYNSAGVYVVKYAVRDSLCNFWDTATYTLEFTPTGGTLNFNYTYDICVDDELVTFTTISSGYHLYEWNFGDGNFSTVRSPQHRFKESGTYTVQLRATDTVCNKVNLVTKQIQIEIVDRLPDEIFPNVFTPDNDGTNDFWMMRQEISTTMFAEFKLEVYNRWGLRVYQTFDAGFNWYGNYQDNTLSEGVYFWVVWYKDLCDYESENHGIVHILR